MQINKTAIEPTVKRLLFVSLKIFIFLFSFNNCQAQKTTYINERIIPFGIRDTAHYRHTSYAEIIATPYLTCEDSSCSIVSFTITILTKCPMVGPYIIGGAQLKGKILDFLSGKYKGAGDTIFIEHIHVRYRGKVMIAPGIILRCE